MLLLHLSSSLEVVMGDIVVLFVVVSELELEFVLEFSFLRCEIKLIDPGTGTRIDYVFVDLTDALLLPLPLTLLKHRNLC